MHPEAKKRWKTALAVSTLLLALACGHGCTPEQADAVLAGLQVTTDQLSNDNSDVSFRDWLAGELDH